MIDISPEQQQKVWDMTAAVLRFATARLQFANGQIETAIVQVTDVDETGMAYCKLPSGGMTVQRFSELETVTEG